ncbi:MAG: hypothetical protein AB6733_21045 [Clostridiaceae bacterium]
MKKRIFMLTFFFISITSSCNVLALNYNDSFDNTRITVDIKDKEMISTFINLIDRDTNAYKCIDNDGENKVIESYKIKSYKEDMRKKENSISEKVNPI